MDEGGRARSGRTTGWRWCRSGRWRGQCAAFRCPRCGDTFQLWCPRRWLLVPGAASGRSRPASATIRHGVLPVPLPAAGRLNYCSGQPDRQWRSILSVTAPDIKPGIMYGASNVPVHAAEFNRQMPVIDALGLPQDALVFTSPLSRCRRLADFLSMKAAARSSSTRAS